MAKDEWLADFTFKRNDPWERDIIRRRDLQRRGKKELTPGAARRELNGLPDDLQPDGKSLGDDLNQQYERNRWDMALADDAQEREDEDADETYRELFRDEYNTDGENKMWREMAGSAPAEVNRKKVKQLREQYRRQQS